MGLLLLAAWAVFYENIRNLIKLVLRKPVKRGWLIFWGCLALVCGYCVYDALWIEPDWLQVNHISIKTGKLPAGSKIRIVQLSDLHIDQIGTREKRALKIVAEQKPDIIVLTGDYVATGEPLAYIGRELVKIAPTYAVAGNWDFAENMTTLSLAGAFCLRDWIEVPCKGGGSIALAGMGFRFDHDPLASCPSTMDGLYKIELCHAPQIYERGLLKWPDLALTGHTHGGQIRLPVFGALAPSRRLVGKYQMGLYHHGGSLLYVNSGLGTETGPPQVRFCCRPEVAVFDIIGSR